MEFYYYIFWAFVILTIAGILFAAAVSPDPSYTHKYIIRYDPDKYKYNPPVNEKTYMAINSTRFIIKQFGDLKLFDRFYWNGEWYSKMTDDNGSNVNAHFKFRKNTFVAVK